MLSHFLPGRAAGGFLGVDLFFVLSGFLITSLLVGEWESTGGIRLGDFWVRRAKRLLPALGVVLGVVMLHGWLTGTGADRHQLGLDGLSSMFYVANWRFIASDQSYVLQFVQAAPSPLRHMWSLAIEEQFYVVWPLAVSGVGLVVARLAGGGRRSIRRPLASVCLGLGFLSATWMIVGAVRGTSLDRLYYGTDTRIFMLLAGAAVGALTAGRLEVKAGLRLVLVGAAIVAAAMVAVATIAVETGDGWLYRGGYLAVAVTLVVLLLGAAEPGPNPLARVLRTRPAVGLGLISYGVYLWHWPIALWVTDDSLGSGILLLVVRSALTLGAALVSYHLVEMPIRRHGLAAAGQARPMVAALAVGALALGFVIPILASPAIAAAPEGPAPTEAAAAVVTEYAGAPRCDVETPAPALDPGRKVTFQVIGNSLAAEVRPCLKQIFQGRRARIVSVAPPDFLICHEAPAIEAQATDPATKPDAAILFLFVAFDDRCGAPWHATIDRLIDTYIANGIHVFLVPTVDIPDGGRIDFRPGAQLESEYYQQRAAADPDHITAVDAGRFLRDTTGTYLWRMPCVASDEAGCRADGTVPVRFVDGVHFCTAPDFAQAKACKDPAMAAGERRAAAAIAAQVLPVMEQRLAASSAGG